MPNRKQDVIIASDGLRARENGAWGRDKLSFLDEFVPAALAATRRKHERYYVDLFSGPGRNVNPERADEFEGSPIRALSATLTTGPPIGFTHAYLVNKDPEDQGALERRVQVERERGRVLVPSSKVQFLTHDANRLVGRIMGEIHLKAYAFVFADITKPSHWLWSTVQQLKSRGHESVDLYLLFPLDMALNRMLNYNQDSVDQSAEVLTAFFGTDEWRTILERRVTSTQSSEMRRQVLDLYMGRLKQLGWKHVLMVRDIHRDGDIGLYKMLYASNHPAGGNIADWSATKLPPSGQGSFF